MALSTHAACFEPRQDFCADGADIGVFQSFLHKWRHDKRPAEIDIYRVMSEQNFIAVAFGRRAFNDVHALLVGRCMKKLCPEDRMRSRLT